MNKFASLFRSTLGKSFFLLSLLLCFGASTSYAQYTKIVFNIPANPNLGAPTCGTTTTTSCLTAYTITDTTAGTTVSSTIPPNSTSYTYTPASGTLVFGYNHTFSLTISGVNSSGVTVTSNAVTATVSDNTLLAPTGFGATLTP